MMAQHESQINLAPKSDHGGASSSSGHQDAEISPHHSFSPSTSSLPDSTNPFGRRTNPKLKLVRKSRLSQLGSTLNTPAHGSRDSHLPHLSDLPVQITTDGLQLYRLSETVPYILGPQEYVAGLDGLAKLNIPTLESRDDEGKKLFKLQATGARDKAMLVILMFADQPNQERNAITYHWLSPFALNEARLQCWKDNRPGNSERMELSFHDFGAMLGDWQGLAPLLSGANDNSSAIPRWSNILDMLKARNIVIHYVDQQLFNELTFTLDQAALESKIDRLQYLIRSGRLPTPRRRRFHAISDTFEYIEPLGDNPGSKPYSHRFSHAHPTGAIYDPNQEQGYDRFFDNEGTEAGAQPKPSVTAALKEGKDKIKKSKRVPICRKVVLILVGMGCVAAIVATCYFKVGTKNNKGFTEQRK